jgi:hypothetical protein
MPPAFGMSRTGVASVRAGTQLTDTLRIANTGNIDLLAILTDRLPANVMPTGLLTWMATPTAPAGQA